MMELSTEKRIAELEAAGWKRRNAGPFMNAIGPLWTRLAGECWTYGLIAEDRHLNPAKVVHGGFLQSLVDHALSTIAWGAVGRKPCITVQTDSQFLSAVTSNEFVVAHGMETHRTSNLIFMRGHLEVDGRKVLAAQSVFKISRQGKGTPVCTENLNPSVAVMKSAQEGV
jgi:acyl-coenzyme A thioesterase PaaI-like protein